MTKDSRGQRGKSAEKITEDWLKECNSKFAKFRYLRLPDARSARGRMAAMPSDYIVFSPAGATFLEVKEILHEHLVPWKNIPQIAQLKAFQLAGCRACVLVLFKGKKDDQRRWRCVDASEIETRSSGSWNWSDKPDYATPEEAFTAKYKWD